MDTIFVYVLIVGIHVIGYVQCEVCTNWNSGDVSCESCCGSWPYEYCCVSAHTWVVAVAVGCTLGGLFLIGLCIVIVCIIIQKKGKSGRVIQPGSVGQPPLYSSAVVYQGPYIQQGVPYGHRGVSYGQQGVAPPPTYPPPEYPPSTENLYGNRPTAPEPEGLQSQPPPSSGLPGNHRAV